MKSSNSTSNHRAFYSIEEVLQRSRNISELEHHIKYPPPEVKEMDVPGLRERLWQLRRPNWFDLRSTNRGGATISK